MIISIRISDCDYEVNTTEPLDISIPLVFNGDQPNVYDVEKASSRAYESNHFVGDTRRGGSCNFEEQRLIPHCNGTHTECVGHITHERISIQSILKDAFIPSTLITVQPEKATDTNDTYNPGKVADDQLITRKSLERALADSKNDFLQGLIIRTLPNDESKKSRRYMQELPPFFSIEAMQHIVQLGIKHLLVDFPSLDRTFDEGKLFTHHLFWDVSQGSHEIGEKGISEKTVTEMIYVPENITDGQFLLNLQIAPFVSDASPSRPVLYRVITK